MVERTDFALMYQSDFMNKKIRGDYPKFYNNLIK